MRRIATLLALGTAAAIALTGCGSSGDDSEPEASASPSADPTTAEASPEASPTTPEASPSEVIPTDDTPLEASDGTDVDACYDGTCEIEVSEPVDIEFDPDLGVGTYRVMEIREDGISLSTLDGMGMTQLGVGGSGSSGNVNTNTIGYTLMSVTDGVAILALYLEDPE